MYRVEWLREAVDELADIWIKADSPFRQEIIRATHALDRELQADPYRQSESREGDVRILFERPLGVLIEVDDRQGIVWILHVWPLRQNHW
ncbi:MAG: type II toxin-antitoxin system RelE family toxin [Isosphaeraceae bacterium]